LFAVINTRAARISNASAKVSTIRTPRRSMLMAASLVPVMAGSLSPSGGIGLPYKDFSSARNRRVACIALVTAVLGIMRNGDPQRAQMLRIEAQERGIVSGRVHEARQEW